jgi:chitosanase
LLDLRNTYSSFIYFSFILIFCGWCKSDLTAIQKIRIESITHVFESGAIQAPYGEINNLGDGRGYTAGRDGFCTATGDLLAVVKNYNLLNPINSIRPYTRRLEELANIQSPEVSSLQGFNLAWKYSVVDPLFIQSQDEISDEYYFCPAISVARELKLKLPISIGQIYDSLIQHGNGNDDDGLPALLAETARRYQTLATINDSEVNWLKTFMQVRLEDLKFAKDPKTRKVWAESAERVEFYMSLLNKKSEWAFQHPVHVEVFGYETYTP